MIRYLINKINKINKIIPYCERGQRENLKNHTILPLVKDDVKKKKAIKEFEKINH